MTTGDIRKLIEEARRAEKATLDFGYPAGDPALPELLKHLPTREQVEAAVRAAVTHWIETGPPALADHVIAALREPVPSEESDHG